MPTQFLAGTVNTVKVRTQITFESIKTLLSYAHYQN